MSYLAILTSAPRTATNNSEVFDWDFAKAYCVLDVTAITATPTLTLRVQFFEEVSQQYVNIASFAAVSPGGAATYTFCLTDQSFAPVTVTETKQCYLTPKMRVRVEHADADSATYTVSFNEVNAA